MNDPYRSKFEAAHISRNGPLTFSLGGDIMGIQILALVWRKKTMKKVISILACLVVLSVCISALPSCCCCIDSDDVLFEFTSNGDGTCNVEAKDGTEFLLMGDVVIPSRSPDGDTVTSIGRYGFSNCDNMTCVTIPDTVTIIDAHAFEGCDSLERVNIPNNVTEVGTYAFALCKSLIMAVVPYGVEKISEHMFLGCASLESVSIRTSVKYIGDYAFDGCTSLEKVLYEGNEHEWGQIFVGSDNEPLYKATLRYGEYAEYNPVN